MHALCTFKILDEWYVFEKQQKRQQKIPKQEKTELCALRLFPHEPCNTCFWELSMSQDKTSEGSLLLGLNGIVVADHMI